MATPPRPNPNWHRPIAPPDSESAALIEAGRAGKSTLAKPITGVDEPDHGEITLGGVPVGNGSASV